MDADLVDYRFRFLGYGNLQAPLWFVGIEEGGSLESNQVHEQTPVPGMDAVYCPQLPTGTAPLWSRYRNIAAAARAPDYFMSNMGAIAKPAERSRLQIPAGEYVGRVRARRIPLLRELVETFQPRAVVFHGMHAWKRYGVREAFGLVPQEGRVQPYPRERLLFTPFVGRLGGVERQEVLAFLEAWLSDEAQEH